MSFNSAKIKSKIHVRERSRLAGPAGAPEGIQDNETIVATTPVRQPEMVAAMLDAVLA
jgi:hypothetical protein